MQILEWKCLSPDQQRSALERPSAADSGTLASSVTSIIEDIRVGGEEALMKARARFEPENSDPLELASDEIARRAALTPSPMADAIRQAMGNIEAFHALQIPRHQVMESDDGLRCELRWQGLGSVGLYVPGGSAPLVSSLMMQAIPARIAGVEEVIVATPGPISPEICFAARECGVDRIFAIGGAQAIAAMAQGIGPFPRCDKIFGPGNQWVTEAKRQVSQALGGPAIDMPAGPSEVLVIADDSAKARFVAADLLSQAEHGEDSQVLLLCQSIAFAEAVEGEIRSMVPTLSRREVIDVALNSARLIVLDSLEEAVQVSNRYAPEHLILQTQSNDQLLASVRNTGSTFLGAYTPESLGDYASGTNHVLPTAGYARAYSGLKVTDFMRSMSVQEASKAGLNNLADCIRELADFEGLSAHRLAVDVRLEDDKKAGEE